MSEDEQPERTFHGLTKVELIQRVKPWQYIKGHTGDRRPKGPRYADDLSHRPRTEIAHELREIRLHRGLTQAQFADLVGVSVPLVMDWETRSNRLSFAHMAAICEKLSCVILITGDAVTIRPLPPAETIERKGSNGVLKARAERHREHETTGTGDPTGSGGPEQ